MERLNDFTFDKTYKKGDVLPADEVNRIFNQVKDITNTTNEQTESINNKVESSVLDEKIEALKNGGFMEVCVSKKKITKETKISEFPVNKICINVIQKGDAETSGFTEFANKSIIVLTNYVNGAESSYQLLRVDGDTNLYTRVYNPDTTGWKELVKIGSDLNVVPASTITTGEAYDEVESNKMSIIGFKEGNASAPDSEPGVIHLFKNDEFGTELFFGFNNELCFRQVKDGVKGPWTKLVTEGKAVTAEILESYKETVDASVKEVSDKVDGFEIKLTTAEEKLAALDGVHEQVTGATQKVEELTSTVNSSTEKVDGYETRIHTLEEYKTSNEEKVTSNQTKITAAEQEIEELKQYKTSNDEKVNGLSTKVEQLEPKVTEASEKIVALESFKETNDAATKELQTQLADANRKIGVLEEAKATLEQSKTDLERRCTELESSKQTLEESVNSAKQELATLTEKVTQLESKVQELAPKQ